MKFNILPFAAFFMLCALSVSCSKNDDNKGIVVAVLKDNVNTQYWQQIAKGISDGAQQNNVISVITYAPTDDGADSQINTLRSLKNKYGNQLEGIILAPSTVAVEAEAIGFDIPVVIVDTPLSDNSPLEDIYHSFLATDNIAAGVAMARQISANSSDILVVRLQSSSAIAKRVQGFLSEKVNASVLLVGDNDCSAEIKSFLQNKPSIKTVFAGNGSTAAFAIKAVKDLNGINIYAFDATATVLDAIRNNQIAGTMAQDTYGMGYNSVEAVYNPYVTKNQYLDVFLINKNNIDTDEAKHYINAIK